MIAKTSKNTKFGRTESITPFTNKKCFNIGPDFN